MNKIFHFWAGCSLLAFLPTQVVQATETEAFPSSLKIARNFSQYAEDLYKRGRDIFCNDDKMKNRRDQVCRRDDGGHLAKAFNIYGGICYGESIADYSIWENIDDLSEKYPNSKFFAIMYFNDEDKRKADIFLKKCDRFIQGAKEAIEQNKFQYFKNDQEKKHDILDFFMRIEGLKEQFNKTQPHNQEDYVRLDGLFYQIVREFAQVAKVMRFHLMDKNEEHFKRSLAFFLAKQVEYLWHEICDIVKDENYLFNKKNDPLNENEVLFCIENFFPRLQTVTSNIVQIIQSGAVYEPDMEEHKNWALSEIDQLKALISSFENEASKNERNYGDLSKILMETRRKLSWVNYSIKYPIS